MHLVINVVIYDCIDYPAITEYICNIGLGPLYYILVVSLMKSKNDC